MIDKSNSKKTTKRRVKEEIIDSKTNSGVFFLQRYEIIIMLLGAGIISMLIFFVFLKPSSENSLFGGKESDKPVSVTIEDFQNQIERLSKMVNKASLKANEKADDAKDKKIIIKQPTNIAFNDHEKRIERIEASLSIKYETLANRITRLERSINKLSSKINSNKKNSPGIVKNSSNKTSKKQETKKLLTKKAVRKKTIKKKKESIFHTVKKGDTLYSLSKQYNTSVRKLEKINHLPENANIYPGDNLLVK